MRFRVVDQWCQYLPQLGLLALLATVADFDLPLSLVLIGNNHLQHGFSHSLIAAFTVALILGAVYQIGRGFWPSALLYFIAYGSHLVIDFFSGSRLGWNNSGPGIPIFWPLSQRFSSPLILFPGVRYMNAEQIFSMDNLWSSIYELLTFCAITIVLLKVVEQRPKRQIVPPRFERRAHSTFKPH